MTVGNERCACETRPLPGWPPLTAALTQPQSNTTVCTVTGTIDVDLAPILSDALAQARGDGNAHLVIDLSAVTSMDSEGLYTLLVARHWHRTGHGGHLAVVVDPGSTAIVELLAVSLKAAFDLHHTLTGALHACVRAQS
ncbi:MAG: STAS domain-containing protein [Pseudonocardiaceae bacterium]